MGQMGKIRDNSSLGHSSRQGGDYRKAHSSTADSVRPHRRRRNDE
jgi:hypothetical protein